MKEKLIRIEEQRIKEKQKVVKADCSDNTGDIVIANGCYKYVDL